MIYRVPQPPLLALAAHKAPHRNPLSLLYLGCHRWQAPLCYAMSSPLPMLCQGEDHSLLWAWYATSRLASKCLALLACLAPRQSTKACRVSLAIFSLCS